MPVYEEPTRCMSAMRMRIIRAELQAGCVMSVFNAVLDGDETIAPIGMGNHPRTTSTGALISAAVSAEQNSTYARAIRNSGWIPLSRDVSNRPLNPTSHRIRIRPRTRPMIREDPPPVIADASSIPTTPVIAGSGMSSAIGNWIWASSTALAPGAAAIVTTQGAQNGHKGDTMEGFPILMGCS